MPSVPLCQLSRQPVSSLPPLVASRIGGPSFLTTGRCPVSGWLDRPQKAAFDEEKKGWEQQHSKLQQQVATEKERNEKTLRRFNQLLAKAQKHGIQAPPAS